ncbi:MAG: helix-turn-helix transcriptional regulator, partial [Oscillospiraceae bacterium]
AVTSGRVNLGAGTVYTILYKMENDGLILAMGEFDRRKVYKITELGRIVLNAEANRILQLADLARETVMGKPGVLI